MESTKKTRITVKNSINAPLHKVWLLWTQPEHIVKWNFANDDWHSPKAENNLRPGGKFSYRMEAKDGSAGFDFSGKYTKVEFNSSLEYVIDDGRKVEIVFVEDGNKTLVEESFEAESSNPVEMQQAGWQMILDNFKKHAESFGTMETMHFEITINTNAETVYKTMLDKEHFKEWTSLFNPTSNFVGSWEKGSTISFLGTDENGNSGGMIGKIKENAANKFVCIEYKGVISDGKEITTGEVAEEWIGGLENYTFNEQDDGKTLLSVNLVAKLKPEFKSYFTETYPKALSKLKSICETT